MNTGTLIAIIIAVLAIIIIIAAAALTYKNIKPTLNKIQETNDTLNQKREYYEREVQHITDRVETLNRRAQFIQEDAEEKSVHFEDFMDEQGKFQTSIRYLKGHAGEYASGIGSNLKDELKEDGPRLAETFKRAIKKTAQKQKVRIKK